MKIAIGVAAFLIFLIVVIVGIGYALPVKHSASRAIALHASTDSVFALISNYNEFPEWRSRVSSVETVVRSDGAVSYREKGKDGDILYVVDESVQSERLVTRIADDKLPFGGTWTFELTPLDNGTQLHITENGEVYNPIFRFVSRFVFGHHATIDTYLNDVARKIQGT